ncbi:zinc finger protein 454-like isoform X10 [Sitophilus oryzae]|uniref:Zinc finger protein 454-like isoform X10 n=1 Tax=Sitophilus oryzae TaxID=7048 RepID=A0A6J2XN59_SITOR|nr:zinc finger protein 454-like isoform X10 [Sitophilus oryzae]
MDNPGEIMRFCRLCLVKDQVNIPIFEEQGDIRQIFLKISSCLPVKVSREDKLPKKICDGCSNKLDLLYEFWNTSANAEKTLLSWLGQAGVKDVDQTITAVAQQIAKPSEPQVKEETPEDGHAAVQNTDHLGISNSAVLDDSSAKDETEEPPPKRARRTAAVKAQINLTPDSEEEDDDLDTAEPMTKIEDESDESDNDDKDPSYVDVPGTSADDQPGPSGVGKDGAEAPLIFNDHLYLNFNALPSNLNLIENFDKTENIYASSVVNQLNESDELLNLLSTEEECTAILNNIAASEHFESLMHTHNEYVKAPETKLEKYGECTNGQSKPSFKCDICKKTFTTKKALKKHLMRHTDERKIPCKICGKLFRFNYELTAHMRSHEGPTLQCDMCPKMFSHKSHLNAHRKRHLGEFEAFCDLCNKGFISHSLYASHKKAIHDNAGHICEVCGLKLCSNSSLKEHRTIHDPSHGKIRSYICNICGKSYITQRNLKSHLIIHSRNKPHVCRVCGKTVSSKNILETHLKMHTGVKDFVCNICDKAFASKEYLEVHTRIHTGYKPFQCNLCPKKFTQKTSLIVHLRYHTGEKPYKCECGKNFTTKSHLMTHYKTHDVGGVEIDYLSYQLHDAIKPC